MERPDLFFRSVLLVVIIVYGLSANAKTTYCNDPHGACENGTCVNGKCVCDSGYAGHDCKIPIEYVMPESDCGVTGCSKKGICINTVPAAQCYCEEGSYGNNCGVTDRHYSELIRLNPTVTTTCSQHGMTIHVMVAEKRTVEIMNHSECAIPYTSTTKQKNKSIYNYEQTFSFSAPPCNLFTTTEIDAGRTKFSANISIKESSGYSTFDYTKIVECELDTNFTTRLEKSADKNVLFDVHLLDHDKIRVDPFPRISRSNQFTIAFFPSEKLLKGHPKAVIGVKKLSMIGYETSMVMIDVMKDNCPSHNGIKMLAGPPHKIPAYQPYSNRNITVTGVTFQPLEATVPGPVIVGFDYQLDICAEGTCEQHPCTATKIPASLRGPRLSFV